MSLEDLNLRVVVKDSVAEDVKGSDGIHAVHTTKNVFATVKGEAPGGSGCFVEYDTGERAVVDYQDLII